MKAKPYDTCGDCCKWMKKNVCPREYGVMIGGPTVDTPACDKIEKTKPLNPNKPPSPIEEVEK
jgi:hypothetical protein